MVWGEKSQWYWLVQKNMSCEIRREVTIIKIPLPLGLYCKTQQKSICKITSQPSGQELECNNSNLSLSPRGEKLFWARWAIHFADSYYDPGSKTTSSVACGRGGGAKGCGPNTLRLVLQISFVFSCPVFYETTILASLLSDFWLEGAKRRGLREVRGRDIEAICSPCLLPSRPRTRQQLHSSAP